MDKRSLTSAINGRKGGRKKGFASIEAEKARNFIAEKLIIHWSPIVMKAIELAEQGDKYSRDWLTDHGYGKAVQAIELTGRDGKALFNDEQKQKSDQIISEFIESNTGQS